MTDPNRYREPSDTELLDLYELTYPPAEEDFAESDWPTWSDWAELMY